MLSDDDKYKLLEIAKKYNISKLYLFGSNLNNKKDPNDIDLAVDGIAGSNFFKFYGELIFSLSKSIDLIDLKDKSLFSDMIRSEGIILYG